MKKLLLILAASALTLGASAQTGLHTLKSNVLPGHEKARAPRAQADEELPQDGFVAFGYCDGIADCVGDPSATKLQAAIMIPKTQASQWKGNKITRVRIGFGVSETKEITVFLTTSLNKNVTPFYTQTATVTNEMGWNDITLTTPYDIEEKAFYIGYSVNAGGSDFYPIGIDGIPTGIVYGGYVALNDSWGSYNTQFGSVCIQAIIEGDNLPKNDVSLVDSYLASTQLLNREIPIELYVTNNGSNNVTSLGLTAEFGDKKYDNVEYVMTPSVLGPGDFGTVTLKGLTCEEEGLRIPYEVDIVTVNGQKDETPDQNFVLGYINCLENGFQRNIVVEEWTGTWCGWCPMGIVGMHKMEEKYGDKNFIGIAVHYGDSMVTTSYSPFLRTFNAEGSYPGGIINRNPNYTPQPDFDLLDYYYTNLVDIPTYAKVDLMVDYDWAKSNVISVETNTTFDLDFDAGRYKIAFVVTENNVGPYAQQNYFSPRSSNYQGIPLEGWDNEKAVVSTYFDHVARQITDVWGLDESVPREITKGTVYNFKTEIPTPDVKNLKIEDCTVVALLLNSASNEIVNAAKFRLVDTSKVDGVESEGVSITTAPGAILVSGDYSSCNVYTLDGRLAATAGGQGAGSVATLSVPAGIYLVKAISPASPVTRKLLVR